MTEMMGCGHAANATDGEGKPLCVTCYGIVPGAGDVVKTPDLTGREARCSYFSRCGTVAPSHTGMPFFGHRPKAKFDSFYCGCRGWD